MIYTRKNIVQGGLIYCIGDSLAGIISNDFSIYRAAGILLIGATVYAFEIPNYFIWINKQVKDTGGLKNSMKRALLALLYFNPLWIARHLFFVLLFQQKWDAIGWSLVKVACLSFVVNIPISIVANHIIQNKISLSYRFLASAIFSGLMAIYYALSYHWFN